MTLLILGSSGHHLRQLDQVIPGVREERQTASDHRQLERLGHDVDTPAARLIDGRLDVRDVEAIMVITSQTQRIAQVLVDRLRDRTCSPSPSNSMKNESSDGGAM
jgi:hypothetical protein